MEGIVNGMDPTEWNPSSDKFIDVPYDKTTVVEGKAAAKQALQAEVGLPLDADAPVFGYIGRLEEQKGCDIMMAAIPKLLKQVPNAQVVILGTGKKSMEKALEKLDEAEPMCAGVVKFSAPLAHFITAGADFLMVPSRSSPPPAVSLTPSRKVSPVTTWAPWTPTPSSRRMSTRWLRRAPPPPPITVLRSTPRCPPRASPKTCLGLSRRRSGKVCSKKCTSVPRRRSRRLKSSSPSPRPTRSPRRLKLSSLLILFHTIHDFT